MGTLSEFFRYLQVKPSQLQDFKKLCLILQSPVK